MIRRSRVLACGHYLPEKILTNADLASRVETSDAWIRERTGITQRHIAAKGELTSDLAAAAARDALKQAGLAPEAIDLIIVATSTPDETFPATAVRTQAKLGMPGIPAFDVQAVCAGFVYALSVADSMLCKGMAQRALVIGAETFSRVVDWDDRGTCILFGDGAGALILEAAEMQPDARAGILATRLHADGRYADILRTNGGVSSTQTTGTVQMQGREVFRHAVEKMCGCLQEALAASGHTVADLDWLVPHQANARIIQSIGQKLNMPTEKVVVTLDKHANTSAASIPLALSTAMSQQKLRKGDLIGLQALGAGLAWGAMVLHW